MKNSTYRLLTIAAVAAFVLFNVTLVQTKPGSPPAGGLSGDPSRITCAIIGCHTGPDLSLNPGDLDFNMGLNQDSLIPITGQTYVPGQTYFMEFKPNMTNGHATRYGFQATSLDVANNMTGAFIVTDAFNNSTQSLLSRNYIGHKDASSFNDWTFQWTAPSTNAGKITFYYTIDAADNNGGTSGDMIYKGSVDLLPNISTGLMETGLSSAVKLFPNPAKENLFVTFYKADNSPAELSVYSADGNLIQTEKEDGLKLGDNTVHLGFNSNVESGVYYLRLKIGKSTETRRFMVL